MATFVTALMMPQGNEFRPHIVKLSLVDVISFVRHDAGIANLKEA